MIENAAGSRRRRRCRHHHLLLVVMMMMMADRRRAHVGRMRRNAVMEMLLRGGGCVGVRRRHLDLLDLRLLQALGFCAPVLKPNLDLRFGEGEGIGEFRALGDGKILLLVELALEGQQLLRRERRPRLPVGFVLAQVTSRGRDAQRSRRRRFV